MPCDIQGPQATTYHSSYVQTTSEVECIGGSNDFEPQITIFKATLLF